MSSERDLRGNVSDQAEMRTRAMLATRWERSRLDGKAKAALWLGAFVALAWCFWLAVAGFEYLGAGLGHMNKSDSDQAFYTACLQAGRPGCEAVKPGGR